MKTKLFTSIVAFFVVASIFAQTNLNNYKYIIVPNKFDFLKEDNQYRMNELAQFLFDKYGFTALMEGSEYPEDLTLNRCLALRSNVLKESGMFKTRLKVTLKDCNDRIVFTSNTGESREKEFKVAYNEAIRDAFATFQTLNYEYEPNRNLISFQSSVATEKVKTETKEEIEKLRQEIETLKNAKETPKGEGKVAEVSITPQGKVVPKEQVLQSAAAKNSASSNVLYAQAIPNGFQLVDSSPKVVYRIKNTGLNNVFIVEGKSAIIYKNGAHWILELHTENEKSLEELNIKF
ncbi:hypothetical protein SAMN05421824_2125 [Hyunsoonleella jejuensis]|uniref:Uncharacterized protein n=1 Tax=Hyunsoonleella jejuensis TaxID=419940 RepID=A0A1H9IB38_9FLAO|nr:hypothetical protein [Hyunsoonleella jejuensis]SEQ71941.1 hypothetical protein SAMN05421824_2125 [Hyunsoonleella jejuensis]